MKNLFKELKGKDIRIKTWDEMINIKGVSVYEDEILMNTLFSDNSVVITSFTTSMKHLCGKIIHVDESMIPEHLFLKAKQFLVVDRELLYYDNITNEYYNLDISMFDVL